MRLEINYRKKTGKITNTWMLNTMVLNNQEITEEIKEERKKNTRKSGNENMIPLKPMGCIKRSFKMEVHSHRILPVETHKSFKYMT